MSAQPFAYPTPWGLITGLAGPAGLRALRLPGSREGGVDIPVGKTALPPEPLRAQLDRYFAGEEETFESLTLDLAGASGFASGVWLAAREIPWGSTASYGELAARIGLDAANARAVGRALGANPLHLVIPCHRFIAQDGGLVNFAAGLEWKYRLLQLEGSLML
jgi:methylated-DNA-[protein]-cysteine S-methyltransferase